MSDLIDRQQTIEAICMETCGVSIKTERCLVHCTEVQAVEKLPPAQPEYLAEQAGILVTDTDTISRQAIDKFIDGFEEIFADIRERHIDDSVCGLCEYDGAYIGQSGDWCNECPGFDKDDCFKLSDKTRKKWTEEIIKALTPIQPANCSEFPNNSDTISRQEAIDICRAPHMRNADCSDFEMAIMLLPSAQPEIIRCRECKFASGDSRICMKFDHSPIGELDFCSFAEKREVTT